MTTQNKKSTSKTVKASKVEAQQIEAIEVTPTVESAPLKTFMELSIEDVKLDLLAVELSASEAQKERVSKNIKARLRTCEVFTKASDKALELIVTNSDEQTLQQLMNYKNYKTATRVLDAAKMLSKESSFSSILTYTLNALQRSSLQKTSVEMICSIANQDYSRVANAIKALAFFGLIDVENAEFTNKLITKMSKNTLVSVAK